MSDDDLVDVFGNAALRAGRSSSGLCISAGASQDWDAMQKWRAALKARLAELRARADGTLAESASGKEGGP